MPVTIKKKNDELFACLKGEIDHHTAPELREAIDEALSLSERATVLVLDFSEVSFMDSSGIALILKLKRLMEISGGDIWIEHPNRQVLRVLEASGIGKLVPITTEVRGE